MKTQVLPDENDIKFIRAQEKMFDMFVNAFFPVSEFEAIGGDDDEHDCHLDEAGMGHCDHPSHKGRPEPDQDDYAETQNS